VTSESSSRIPPAQPARLDPAKTAVLVLDMTLYTSGPNPHHQAILPALAEFLKRARNAGVPIVFTGARTQLGQPVEPALEHRPGEPLIYPDAFDKFKPGELRPLLDQHQPTDLVITGGAVNMAVMYTATAAARDEHYQVYIPLDGVYTPDAYRYEYALYQLTVLPGATIPPRFTRLADIALGS
jgi:nicotinamidase-related amidase